MAKEDIEPDATYLSVHDVLYHVIKIDGQKVTAKCKPGRSEQFEISLGRFAATMKKRV